MKSNHHEDDQSFWFLERSKKKKIEKMIFFIFGFIIEINKRKVNIIKMS